MLLCRTAFGASSVETICGSLEVQLPCHVNVLGSLHLSQLVSLSPFYSLENPKHRVANHHVRVYSQAHRRTENTLFSLLHCLLSSGFCHSSHNFKHLHELHSLISFYAFKASFIKHYK